MEVILKTQPTGVFALRGITGLGSDLRPGLGNAFDAVGLVSTCENKDAIAESDNRAAIHTRSVVCRQASPVRWA